MRKAWLMVLGAIFVSGLNVAAATADGSLHVKNSSACEAEVEWTEIFTFSMPTFRYYVPAGGALDQQNVTSVIDIRVDMRGPSPCNGKDGHYTPGGGPLLDKTININIAADGTVSITHD